MLLLYYYFLKFKVQADGLHQAAYSGQVNIIKFLLEKKVDFTSNNEVSLAVIVGYTCIYCYVYIICA